LLPKNLIFEKGLFMKHLAFIIVCLSLLTTGCASTVITYDGNGKMIGKCESQGGLVLGGGAACTGSANAENPQAK
jgi:hypothetical protein